MSIEQRQIEAGIADLRLDRWFKQHYPQLGHAALNRLLRTGQIRVDGKRAKVDTRVSSGQSLRIPPLEKLLYAVSPYQDKPAARAITLDDEQRAELEQSIIYEDDDLLVFNKPAQMAVQGGTGVKRSLDKLAVLLRPQTPPKLMHRIDRDTSGIVLFAKTQIMAQSLGAQFKQNKIRKIYWALVVGRPQLRSGQIIAPLLKLAGQQGERMVVDHQDGAYAETNYQEIDHAAKRLAWLSLEPKTGRTHQLRVHCLTMGHPILGDFKYGGAQAKIAGMNEEMHLHAREIHFHHPKHGAMQLEASLPAHMQESFRLLGFQNRDANALQNDAPWL